MNEQEQNIIINRLVGGFHTSVNSVVNDAEKQGQMHALLHQFNPNYHPLVYGFEYE